MVNRKNDDLQVKKVGEHLQGKSIALCISGGIAAIEAPKIARHLRRYGAEVRAYVSPSTYEFVGKAALEWGTGQEVVDRLSGMAEHICLDDLVLVTPATLNTVNKMFSGIADNPMMTLIGSALGKKVPVYIAPTMHESMYQNPFLLDNLARAEKYGVHVFAPRIEEGKAKMPHIDTIVAAVCRELSNGPLKGKKMLVTGGPTAGKLDDVRRLTTIFSGELGVLIAKEAYLRGADVKLLLGKTKMPIPEYLPLQFHGDYEEYRQNVFAELERGYDIGIFSAAVADYIPSEVYQGKIPSQGELKSIPVKQTAKVIAEVRQRFQELYMATFKYECGLTREELLAIARGRVERGYQLVVANRGEDMVGGEHKAYIVGKEEVLAEPWSKREIAQQLMGVIGSEYGKR